MGKAEAGSKSLKSKVRTRGVEVSTVDSEVKACVLDLDNCLQASELQLYEESHDLDLTSRKSIVHGEYQLMESCHPATAEVDRVIVMCNFMLSCALSQFRLSFTMRHGRRRSYEQEMEPFE